jgi:hypothetical protein
MKDDEVVAADRDLRELATKVERLGMKVGSDAFVSLVSPRDRRLVLDSRVLGARLSSASDRGGGKAR